MYPESNITNMIEGYKDAILKSHKDKKQLRRADEIKRFLAERNIKINPDNTWTRT